MIHGLFETHLDVADLERSRKFYGETLGLDFAYVEEERRVAFYWIGGRGSAMLGLWERSASEIVPRHFAFRSSEEEIRLRSANWLRERGIEPFNFFRDGTDRPMVFAWMPAVALYFNDPDGHLLELIAMIDGTPRPELGVMMWDEWERVSS